MIRLRVHGVPMPQGSKTAFVRGNRAILTDGRRPAARASHAAWRQAVATAARDYLDAGGEHFPAGVPLAVRMDFLLVKPKSKPKRVVWPTVKPDALKLGRAVEDALVDGGLLTDDAQIVDLHVTKRYAIDQPPGCLIDVAAAS